MHALIPSCYMHVTGVRVSDQAQYLGQIEKLVNSHALHSSESLCKLLKYLGHHAMERPGTPLKEYQIATELFGRQSDFDPQVDSMVRVQAGRLRSKLSEYYASEGSDDALWVELPKGSYVLTFHPRPATAPSRNHSNHISEVPQERKAPPTAWISIAVLSLFLVAALGFIGYLLSSGKSLRDRQSLEAEKTPVQFVTFWKGFLTGPEEPLVIISNAAFIGRPDIGLRYFDSTRDSKAQVFDHYTGVGEVLAVHSLDVVFDSLHQPIRVKRGSLFSLDDAKDNDLIFIGSPSENLTLLEIPGTQQFKFRNVPAGPRKGNMEITNVHPGNGEPLEFLASPSDVPLTEDYAVIALIHGLNPARSVLILAGTTTLGTQAAVEYVCREDSLKELLTKLSVNKPSDLKPFEALLHVKVARGVPVASELIAVRSKPQ